MRRQIRKALARCLPIFLTALLAAFGSGYVIALYILLCAIISIIATAMLPDYTNRDISEEHDRP